MSKKPKMTTCRICNNMIAENAKQCPHCGAKNKKPFYKRWWVVLIAIIVVICAINSISNTITKKSEKKAEYRWPDSELASLISAPSSKYGKIILDDESYFSIDVYEISNSQFEDYIEDCRQKGFTEDYSRSSNSYYADNSLGYSLSLFYNEKEKELSIYLNEPIYENTEIEANVGTEFDVQENEEITQEWNESDIFTEEIQTNENNGNTVDGVSPELKAFLDEYEEFMNQYIDFMVKYESSDNVVSMLADYGKMLQQYAEFTDKIDKYNSDEMSAADAAYYLEVTSRVSAKMLKSLG